MNTLIKYSDILKNIIGNIQIINPNLYIKNVENINYDKLKEMGIQYIVFDKDNTLTKHLETKFTKKSIETTINSLQNKYPDSIYLVSNGLRKLS